MKISNSDFRPKQRSGQVPSGKPRRKIPVLRLLLLLGVGLFVYARFDSFWPQVRKTFSPAALWRHMPFAGPPPVPMDTLASRWSYARDSSQAALQCDGGLDAACCEILEHQARGLCGNARALLAKSAAFGMIGKAGALRLEVDAAAGHAFYALSALQGRDERGGFRLSPRGDKTGQVWCDAQRGCLGAPRPQAPLAGGRLRSMSGTADENAGKWIGSAAAVRAALPGRVAFLDSTARGPRVWIYHGRELYTSYESLRLAPGVRPGVRVGARASLGSALPDSAGYAVIVRVRQDGINLDPAEFFSVESAAP